MVIPTDNNKLGFPEREEGSRTNHRQETGSPGEMLRRARIERGLDIETLSSNLGLATFQLKHLENDRYENLPSRLYVRGYIKNCCTALQIDPAPILASYEQLLEGQDEAEILQQEVATNRKPLKDFAILIAIALALVVFWLAQPDSAQESSVDPVASPQNKTEESIDETESGASGIVKQISE